MESESKTIRKLTKTEKLKRELAKVEAKLQLLD